MKSGTPVSKLILYTAALIITAFFIAEANLAKAESVSTTQQEQKTEPACELDQALDELLAVKDGALAGPLRDRVEFRARKAVLTQTIVCANAEITKTETRLNKLAITTSTSEDLRAQFLSSLSASKDKYKSYAEVVATSTGLINVKELAEDILEWRKSEYLPLLSKINDFILVTNNEESLKIARARFEKISSTLSILQLANIVSIKKLLLEAAAFTKEAEALNHEAGALVYEYLVPIYTASSSTELLSSSTLLLTATGTIQISEDSTEGRASSTSKEVASPPTVVSLVKASLESLRDAYANYLKISATVRNILGL